MSSDDNRMMRRADGGLVFDAEQRQILRDTYANGCSDGEFAVLMEVAAQRELNPFKREIFFVQRWDSEKHRMVWQPQVSVDGLRLIAQRTGLYDGQDEPEFIEEADGSLKVCKVRVWRKDWTRPVTGVAYWSEYVQTTKDKQTGKTRPNSTWSKMPRTMLAKCAESLALRKAFPAHTAGLYTAEETGQADNERPAPRPAIEAQPAPAGLPSSLPSDNGPPPSRAAASRPLTDEEHRAMLDTVRGATTRDALDREVADLADAASRGTEAQREELRAAIVGARKALKAQAAAETTPPPDGDDTPPNGPTKPRRPRATTAPADATGATVDAANDPQGAAASAWEPFRTSDGVLIRDEAHARAVLRGYPLPRLARSSRLHTPAWGALCDAEAAERAAMPATGRAA